MRTISGPLKTAVSQNATTLARLVDIELANGREFHFTNSDADITFDGNVYLSTPGCNPSQVRSVLGTSSESVTVDTLIHPAGITAGLIESGSLDDARLRLLVIDYTAPNTAVTFFLGFVSSVSYKDKITASIVAQPLVSRDVQLAQDVYQSNCRADLGDEKCRFNIEGMKVNTVVTEVVSLQQFFVADLSVDSHWQAGTVLFTAGENEGFSFEIQDNVSDGDIRLRGIMPFPLAVGDTCTLYPGCDKTTTMCTLRYANILNFRGEPFAIAPWIATSQAPITTSTTSSTSTSVSGANQRALYIRWGFVSNSFNTHPINSGDTSTTGVVDLDNPEFGPVADVWGFAPNSNTPVGGGASSGTAEGGTDLYAGARRSVVTSDMTQLYFGSGGAGLYGYPFNYVEFGNRQLTDAEAAQVRQKYPSA